MRGNSVTGSVIDHEPLKGGYIRVKGLGFRVIYHEPFKGVI